MHTLSNPFVLGYHGCRKDTGEALLSGRHNHLKASENLWDWLGSGIYFWEADPLRGLEWAEGRYGRNDAFVIGAVIHLGNCLDLMSRRSVRVIAEAYQSFVVHRASAGGGAPLPVNKMTAKGPAHALDCAVINHLHDAYANHRDRNGTLAPLPAFNTVRGLYQESPEAFPGSMIQAKTHIQICVRTPEHSIKGYMRVPEPQLVRM